VIVGCLKPLIMSSTVKAHIIFPSLLLGTGYLFYYIYLALMNIEKS
jgi:hypothetical protein